MMNATPGWLLYLAAHPEKIARKPYLGLMPHLETPIDCPNARIPHLDLSCAPQPSNEVIASPIHAELIPSINLTGETTIIDDPVFPVVETAEAFVQTAAPPPPPATVDAAVQTVYKPEFKKKPTPRAPPKPVPAEEEDLFTIQALKPAAKTGPAILHTAAAMVGVTRPEEAAAGAIDKPYVQPNQPRKRKAADRDEPADPAVAELLSDPRMNAVPAHLAQLILGEIAQSSGSVRWADVVGLGAAKKAVTEAVIWPLRRPDLFTGLTGPRGVMLFGPPGNGKTMIGRALANEAGATFFNISASSLMSKWAGEGEKLVRALFTIARIKSPSIVFIDEIDSVLAQRGDDDANSGSRRMKTEFLVQIDGTNSGTESVILLAATNRPSDIDEAARRRFTKRLYVPLPDALGRRSIVANLLPDAALTDADRTAIVERTELFSGSDLKALCQEAAMGPIRDAMMDDAAVSASQVRCVGMADIEAALGSMRPSVDAKQLGYFEDWNASFGSGR
ncbi:fidgetin-like protein [Carpediemonas membranifera]|uniref:Fidgetin-like protein n=1 Tax=Carpediemonas membranifera TaxID=201153 RepID=A0A8J6ARX7_9EUKA|nr:fidgetin-like protein [Carpediemonas membranifera]|eukprot:KAG9392821.1 fidgetin-like protein [Carpediemonas membranifera]